MMFLFREDKLGKNLVAEYLPAGAKHQTAPPADSKSMKIAGRHVFLSFYLADVTRMYLQLNSFIRSGLLLLAKKFEQLAKTNGSEILKTNCKLKKHPIQSLDGLKFVFYFQPLGYS